MSRLQKIIILTLIGLGVYYVYSVNRDDIFPEVGFGDRWQWNEVGKTETGTFYANGIHFWWSREIAQRDIFYQEDTAGQWRKIDLPDTGALLKVVYNGSHLFILIGDDSDKKGYEWNFTDHRWVSVDRIACEDPRWNPDFLRSGMRFTFGFQEVIGIINDETNVCNLALTRVDNSYSSTLRILTPPISDPVLDKQIGELHPGDRVRITLARDGDFLYAKKIQKMFSSSTSTTGGSSMSTPFITMTVWHYIAYLIISIFLTIWVGRTLHKNGRIFLVDAFVQNEKLADSVNHLLLVGFYLINFGYVSFMLQSGIKPVDLQELFEALSVKIGTVLLVLGGMHFFNLYVFSRIRKKGMHSQVR